MRRSLRTLAISLVLLLAAVAPVAPRAALADSWVVGSEPFDDVVAAARAVLDADVVDCGLTRNRLTAMTLAVVWPEVGSSHTLAPSPMTLSRWDTSDALYAFRSPSSPYQRAFWHPGIGMWQLDSAGLGAPYTAAERIHTATAARVAARTIKDRYCVYGTMADAWRPWHACNTHYSGDSLTKCRRIYEDLYWRSEDAIRWGNLDRVSSVTRAGGMVARSCEVEGVADPVPCHYVDPSRAQGQTWWTNPASGASPISAPFYVWKHGGYEHRAWLPGDTGYGVVIHARRQLGRNARSSVSGGGVAWDSTTSLCDLTALRGVCLPRPIDGFTVSGIEVRGTYRPVEGDFDGDGFADVLWYAPGDGTDYVWFGRSDRGFDARRESVRGAYVPVEGDFDGDGFSDVLWYGPGSGYDALWSGGPSGDFSGSRLTVRGTYRPVSGDVDGDADTDVIWYAPGEVRDWYWFGRPGGGFTSDATSVDGTYTPFSLDVDRDGSDDVVWYGRGSDPDRLWRHTASGIVSSGLALPGYYRPITGDFDGAEGVDVFWYRPGGASDTIWFAV